EREHRRRSAAAARRRRDADPGAPVHGHRLHAHPRRPRLHPQRPRHADRPAEPGARRDRAVPDDLRDGPDVQGRQGGRDRPAARGEDLRVPGVRPRPEAAARVHVPPDAREGPRPLREARRHRDPEDPPGRPDPRPHPRLHHLRAQDGVPDRLPDLPAVPRDRPRRVQHAHVDGHDHAAADLDQPPVQDPAVRPRRRLEPGHPKSRGVLRM
ncbi:MAG: Flagellar biosynthesis protein FliP, partial [uncultured Solirubrobacteraceae bacterium]